MTQFIKDMATKALLSFDTIADVEHAYDKRPGELNERQLLVATAMQVRLSETRADHLREIGDTMFSNTISYYKGVITSAGFERVYYTPLDLKALRDEERMEEFYVYAHRENGVVLCFDTHYGNVNSAHAFCIVRPQNMTPSRKDFEKIHRAGNTAKASFQFESLTVPKWRMPYGEDEPQVFPPDLYAFVTMDAREALMFRLRQLGEATRFVPGPWPAVRNKMKHLNLYSSYQLKHIWDQAAHPYSRLEETEKLSHTVLAYCTPWFQRMINVDNAE